MKKGKAKPMILEVCEKECRTCLERDSCSGALGWGMKVEIEKHDLKAFLKELRAHPDELVIK